MDLKKWSPWNWFKKEDDVAANIPVNKGESYPAARADYGYPSPMFRLHNELDRIFDDMLRQSGLPSLFRQPFPASEMMLKPQLDIKETEEKYTISVEIPGVDEKDVHLDLHDDTLTITGEKKFETEEKKDHFHKIERRYGSFQRVLCLPTNADREHISAKFNNGILTIELGKHSPQQSGVKKIEINKN